MKKKEKSYIIIFDKHKNFKEIRVLSESSDPFVVNPKSVGNSIYIYTQKEFAKLIESAMRHLTEPVGENDMFENIGQQVILPDGNIGYIKSVKDGSTKYINIDNPLPVSNKDYLKYYKVHTGTCSDSSSTMPTEAGATDATKTIKQEYNFMVLAFILLLLIFGISMYLMISGIILEFVLVGFPIALMVTNLILGVALLILGMLVLIGMIVD